MKYLSVCSGIEAASVAWHTLGWEPLAFSEIETFPRKVLAHHYPDVPLHGDFTILKDQPWIKDADLLVGGTPCQAFSVAGLRQSLADDRGNLTLEFVRLANAIDDLRCAGDGCTIVWENVPGVLSVKDNAFGCFLAALVGNDAPLIPTGGKWTNAGLVVGPQRSAAWRILDAQYFGVAQRRRRVFVVSSATEGFDPAEILFEREGMRRDSAPRREAGERIAPTVTSGPPFSRTGNDRVETDAIVGTIGARTGRSIGAQDAGVGHLLPDWPAEVASTLNAAFGSKLGLEDQHINGGAPLFVPTAITNGQVMETITARMFNALGARDVEEGALLATFLDPLNQSAGNISKTLAARSDMDGMGCVSANLGVRRLTPTECERLQGFPDNYTDISEKTPDGPRYKAIGNSMAVPVMRWIGERIQKVAQQ
ncbi:cytosine specific methyltransferase [Caudoviricetes sp.]|nr:cytosine specific methyltransferase [Caudoviricetes sp.]